MDRRTLAASAVLLLALGWLFLLTDAIVVPSIPGGSPVSVPGEPRPVITGLGTAVLALAAVGVLVLLAHQYMRWREYRPAIHLAALTAAFIAGVAWWLGPAGLVDGAGTLTPREKTTIRVAALGFLFVLVLSLSRYLDTDGGD